LTLLLWGDIYYFKIQVNKNFDPFQHSRV